MRAMRLGIILWIWLDAASLQAGARTDKCATSWNEIVPFPANCGMQPKLSSTAENHMPANSVAGISGLTTAK
jgi:hypothetical protein